MHMLILIHIVLLMASILLTVGSTIAAVVRSYVPRLVNRLNIAFTTVGIGAGVILLLDKPLGARCAALTAYLAVFTLAQVYIRRHNTQPIGAATR